jgi:hypothetical protein
MALTIKNLDDAMLRADNKFRQWQKHFEQQWNEPQNIAEMRAMVDQMPLEMRQAMRQANPAVAKQLNEQYGVKL